MRSMILRLELFYQAGCTSLNHADKWLSRPRSSCWPRGNCSFPGVDIKHWLESSRVLRHHISGEIIDMDIALFFLLYYQAICLSYWILPQSYPSTTPLRSSKRLYHSSLLGAVCAAYMPYCGRHPDHCISDG